MVRITGVQFDGAGKLYYFDPGDLPLKKGDTVLVETANGQELGKVLLDITEIDEESLTAPLKPVIRVASEQDLLRAKELDERSKTAFDICKVKIRLHKLDMKLISAKYMFDLSKILFCFTADERVDFRALVRDLSYTLRSRVELRQVGSRDEARMRGGLGPCGRVVCCRSFLHEFQTVSIKAAKDQSLSLNPTKISGICGKLMCCLKYEQDAYVEAHKRMPRIGRTIATPDGAGTVTEVGVLRETVKVRISRGDSSEVKEYPLAALQALEAQPAAAAVPEAPAVPEGDALPAAEAAAEKPEVRTRIETPAAPPIKRTPAFGPGSEKPREPRQRLVKPVARTAAKPQNPRPVPVARTNPRNSAAPKKSVPAAAQPPVSPAPKPESGSKGNSWRKALEEAKRAAHSSES